MAIRESELTAVQVPTLNDYIRMVTMAGESRNVALDNLSKTIIEDYIGTELADENQSVASAVNNMAGDIGTINGNITAISEDIILITSNTEIDSEVTDLYEELGWMPDNQESSNEE